MKLQGAAGAAFCLEPDRARSAALLHGPDAGLLALRRAELVRAVAGDDRMAVTRIEPDRARRDPALVEGALKARGFFSGRPVVVIEGAKDGLTEALKLLLPELGPEDGFLIVTSVGPGPKSSLRKLFEGARAAAAVGLYPDPPGEGEIARRLEAAGAPARIAADALARLAEIGAEADPGGFARLLETVALHAHGAGELSLGDVEAVAPRGMGRDVDALVAAVAEGRAERVGPLLSRLAASGADPAAALSATARHFRQLFRLFAAPEGPRRALDALRPPVRGPRRTALEGQIRLWSAERVEDAVRTLFEAEKRLRSPGPRPAAALAERALLRVAFRARAAR
jgi:DNA polymerase-3 subunit delta